jgi:mannose-1-phosphate guanylyltransferase/mannose-6-phosphate isomerase
MKNIQSVIMAGGSGSRLWPISKSYLPKQFIKLFDGKSLLQITLERNREFTPPAIMVRKEHGLIAKSQIDEMGIKADIIIEPCEKNTAPCAIIAALYAKEKQADAVLLLPVDHFIQDKNQYISSMKRAVAISTDENIVTFGIKPTKAHSGYGYMKTGLELSKRLFAIKKFIEKPDAVKAAEYIKSGDYYWNSGIFVFEPETMMNIATELAPEMYKASYEAFNKLKLHGDFIALDSDSYNNIKPNSIDFAFMEKYNHISMIKADFAWRDVGCWNTMWELYEKDSSGNVIYGTVEVSDTKDSYIHSEGKLTAVIGVRDLVVVNTHDAALVMHKSKSESMKKLVKRIAKYHPKQL